VGKGPDNWTIDRINPNRGYSLDNIRPLEHRYNSAQGKYNIPRYLRAEYEAMENAK
jgi:hypothetical protein